MLEAFQESGKEKRNLFHVMEMLIPLRNIALWGLILFYALQDPQMKTIIMFLNT
jgi:hypothetical protein